MGNLIIFAVIGLLAGAASRLFYPGGSPGRSWAVSSSACSGRWPAG